MSISVVTMPDLSAWPTIHELAARTGMSARSIYREIEAGKIRTATRPVPHRKPVTVLHPLDADAWATAVLTPRSRIVPSGEIVTVTSGAVAKPVTVTAKSTSKSDGKAAIEWPISELRHKLVLTMAEAVRCSGYGEHFLEDAVEWRKVGPRRARVCLMEDLKALQKWSLAR